MQRHEWRVSEGDRTDYWRADHHGGRWMMSEKLDGADHWTKLDPPRREHYQALREVLWDKYQRKRCSFSLIKKLDKMLAQMK